MNLSAEQLQISIRKLFPLLALCFNGFLVHDSVLYVVLVSIVKDKTVKINKENYWPVCYPRSCTFRPSKMEHFLLTSDKQFGFKSNHDTDMCIFTLKDFRFV